MVRMIHQPGTHYEPKSNGFPPHSAFGHSLPKKEGKTSLFLHDMGFQALTLAYSISILLFLKIKKCNLFPSPFGRGARGEGNTVILFLCCCLCYGLHDSTTHAAANASIQSPPAQRVITLAPHATDLVQAIGGQHRLIAAATHATDDLPSHIMRINTYGGLDRELILQLAPDLVIAWTSGNRPSDLAWLAAQDIPIYHSEPYALADLADQMRAIGELTGLTATAEQAADDYLRKLQTHCMSLSPTETYLQIWSRPAMSVGGHHWLNDVLRYAGLRNTYAAVQRGIFSVETESLFSKRQILRVSSNQEVQTNPRSIWVPNMGRPSPSILNVIQTLCAARPYSTH